MSRGKVAIVGGGAWGTALASVTARNGAPTMLFARDAATVAAINGEHQNPRYLPELDLPEALFATQHLGEALAGAEIVLLVVPAQMVRAVTAQMVGLLGTNVPIVLCSKGIEQESGRFAADIAAECLPGQPIAVLSGPSFASDVAAGLPTAVTLAAADDALAEALSAELSGAAFRIYASADIRGVEAGGALKNVLAIAAGAVAGRGLGASATAAIVTRGFVELRRLGAALGAQPETLMGLSGLGDLVLTCASAQSRNFAYGMALGSGADITGMKLAEGVFSAGIAARLAAEKQIEAPIIETVAAILAARLSVDDAIARLLARPLQREDRRD